MKKRGLYKKILLLVLTMIAGLILFFCVPTFDAGDVLEEQDLGSYNKIKIIAMKGTEEEEFTDASVEEVLNLLYPLKVSRKMGGSHWHRAEHTEETEYQFEMLFHDGMRGYFHIRLCENELSFQLPEKKRYAGYDFHTYCIRDKEQYRMIAQQLFEVLQ